jgi:hypothetical protein
MIVDPTPSKKMTTMAKSKPLAPTSHVSNFHPSRILSNPKPSRVNYSSPSTPHTFKLPQHTGFMMAETLPTRIIAASLQKKIRFFNLSKEA